MSTIQTDYFVTMPGKYFYARPLDHSKKGLWCVAEVDIDARGARWESTLYEPVLSRMAKGNYSIKLTGMTKAQARKEAKLWTEKKRADGEIPKKKARAKKR